MFKIKSKSLNNNKNKTAEYLIITAGTFITAFGIVMFLLPYNIVAGGVSGLAIVLNYLFNWWVGAQMLIYNVFLFALGFKLLGLGFGLKSIYSALSLSFFIDFLQVYLKIDELLPNLVFEYGKGYSADMILMSSIYGAITTGVGMGLVIWRGATTGGTDILAMISNKYFLVSVGTGLMIVDAVITASSVLINPLMPMYGLITIFIVAKVIDAIVNGLESTRTILIISDYHDKIKGNIYEFLDRGITYIKGAGGYTQEDKDIIMVTVSRSEMGNLKKIVNNADEKAFFVVIPNSEAIGYGFKRIK